jgi:hypothetical protein
VSPVASGDKFEGKIVEVVGVRSLQDDKNESKIVEVDYEIPPNVGMTNFTQINL